MFEGLDIFQVPILEPGFDFFEGVVIALGCREDIEGIIEFHIEREICVVGEGKFFREGFESHFCEEISEEVDEMDSETRDIAELEENRFWKFLEEASKWFVEIDRAGIVSAIIDPDEKFPTSFECFREFEKSLLRTREVMQDADGIGNIESVDKWHVIDVSLDDTDIWEIPRHGEGNLDGLTEIGAERDFRSGESSPLGKSSGSATDVESLFPDEVWLAQKGRKKVKKVVFLVGVLFINVFPFVSETLGCLLLMFPEGIEVRDAIDSSLPFIADVGWEFFFPGIEEILMDLEKILLQFLGENSRDTAYNWIPGIFCGEDAGGDMVVVFFEYRDAEWFVGDWIGEVLQVISSHRVFQDLNYKKESFQTFFIISQPFSMSFFP